MDSGCCGIIHLYGTYIKVGDRLFVSEEKGLNIRFQGLCVSYLESGQSLSYTGEMSLGAKGFSVIQGASGCGKTTLLHCLAGVLGISNTSNVMGEVEGLESVKVAMMFQELRLFGHRSVRQHLGDVGVSDRVCLGRWLDFVGLGEDGDLLPSSLSGGMGRRLSFARVLAYGDITSAGLYLLDEPFTGVDEVRILSFLDYLDTLAVPVLIATHQPVVVERSESVYYLREREEGGILVEVDGT